MSNFQYDEYPIYSLYLTIWFRCVYTSSAWVIITFHIDKGCLVYIFINMISKIKLCFYWFKQLENPNQLLLHCFGCLFQSYIPIRWCLIGIFQMNRYYQKAFKDIFHSFLFQIDLRSYTITLFRLKFTPLSLFNQREQVRAVRKREY